MILSSIYPEKREDVKQYRVHVLEVNWRATPTMTQIANAFYGSNMSHVSRKK